MTFLGEQEYVPGFVGFTRTNSPRLTCSLTSHREILRPARSMVPSMPAASNEWIRLNAARIDFRVTPLTPSVLTTSLTASRKAMPAAQVYAPKLAALSTPVYFTKLAAIVLAFRSALLRNGRKVVSTYWPSTSSP